MRQDTPPAASAGGQPVPLSTMAQRRLTRYARLPERIVLCIDVSPEMGQPWSSSSSSTSTRLDILKQALNAFLHFKSIFNPRHEYALVTVDEEESRVVLPFTSTIPDIFRTLDCIAPVGPWPPAAAATATASGINLAHLFGSTLPSLFSNYLEKKKEHASHNHKKPSSSSHPALARAILFMGASYALPLLPEPSVIESLFVNDKFFFDMMYIHARKASPPLPPPPPPLSSSTAAEVVVVDLDNDEDEVAVVEPPTAAAAAAAAPPPSLPSSPLVRRSDEIWDACLELLIDTHPFLPECGYCFSVLHGSNTDRVMTPLQLLLAHPAQRLPQTLAEERLNYRQGQKGGKGGGGRKMKKKEEREEEAVEEEGGGGGRMEVTTPSPRGGGVGVRGTMS